jgi:hypothetical protein
MFKPNSSPSKTNTRSPSSRNRQPPTSTNKPPNVARSGNPTRPPPPKIGPDVRPKITSKLSAAVKFMSPAMA